MRPWRVFFKRKRVGTWVLASLLAALIARASLLAQDPDDPRGLAISAINPAPPFLVRVDVDRPDRIYRGGDVLAVSVKSEREGYLYLFYCDAGQQVTCLFPNQVQQDNHIPANQTIVVPDASARFSLRVGPPFGNEVLKAVVTTEPLHAIEISALTKGGFAPLKPQKLKAVFVEVRGEPGVDASPAPGSSPPASKARLWSEHHLQITTAGGKEEIPRKPDLGSIPQVAALLGGTQPAVATQPAARPLPTTADRPKRIGIFVGISKFQDPGIRPLRVADRDAQTMAGVMQERGQLDEAVLLVNEQATLANIQQIIQQGLPAATSPGDLVIIYWSGHGGRTSNLDGTEPDGYDEYLVPYDGRLEPASAIRQTMLLDKTFGRWVLNLDGRKLVFIIDACHSGGQTQGAIKAITGGAPEAPFRKFFFANTLSRTKDIGQRETAVLASSRASQVSFEQRGDDLSVMTHFLVEKLRGSQGPVTLKETADYLMEQVPAFVERYYPGTTQTPVFVDATTPPVLLGM